MTFRLIDKCKKAIRKVAVKILTAEAKAVLLRYRPKIIAVTGSVGKTSTKDAIFTVLSKFKSVRKNEKSYNSEFGVPLTILGLPNGWNNPWIWIENVIRGLFVLFWSKEYPKWLILEVGAGKPNDIKNIAPWLSPDIVVITCFPNKPVHIEFFGSVERIIEEKSALAFALKKEGTLILNHDDEKVYALHAKANRKTVSYGVNENATYHISNLSYQYQTAHGITYPEGINFKLAYGGSTFPVILPQVIGMHYVGAATAALAVANEAGCELLGSTLAIKEFITPPGRLTLVEGIKGSIILDDTYNASPIATEAALKILIDIKAKRKIVVLGDMLELGKLTEEAHREIGEQIVTLADILITVGPRSKYIAEGALDKGFRQTKIHHFDTSQKAGEFLQEFIQEGDVVLLKGSQGVRLERAVKALMAYPDQASKILARQEKEWQKR